MEAGPSGGTTIAVANRVPQVSKVHVRGFPGSGHARPLRAKHGEGDSDVTVSAGRQLDRVVVRTQTRGVGIGNGAGVAGAVGVGGKRGDSVEDEAECYWDLGGDAVGGHDLGGDIARTNVRGGGVGVEVELVAAIRVRAQHACRDGGSDELAKTGGPVKRS